MHEAAKTVQFPDHAFDVIMKVHLAKDPPQLLDSLMDATVAIGATASLYAASIPENGCEPSSFSLFACDPRFVQRQARIGPIPDHPWFRFARTHTSPGTHHEIPLGHASDAEAIHLAREHGFASCLVVPMPAGADLARVEMLCLGSDRESRFDGEDARAVRALARSLAAELHDWMTRHLSGSLQQQARLKKSDIEILGLQWQGLSTKEISRRTGMSRASINSRFQRLNAKLDCASRRESARKAAEHGVLEAYGAPAISARRIRQNISREDLERISGPRGAPLRVSPTPRSPGGAAVPTSPPSSL